MLLNSGYNLNAIHQSVCKAINPIALNNYAYVLNSMPTGETAVGHIEDTGIRLSALVVWSRCKAHRCVTEDVTYAPDFSGVV